MTKHKKITSPSKLNKVVSLRNMILISIQLLSPTTVINAQQPISFLIVSFNRIPFVFQSIYSFRSTKPFSLSTIFQSNMPVNPQLFTLITIFALINCPLQVFGRDPPVEPLIFTDIPRSECPKVCYTDKFGKSVATIQCTGRSQYCEVTKCGSGFSCTDLVSSRSVSITLESGGSSDGDTATIIVNRQSVFTSTLEGVPTSPQRSANIVVLDQITGEFKRYINFDFRFSSTNNEFKSFLSGKAFGTIIILVMKGDIGRWFSTHSRWLIDSLGSAYSSSLDFGDSFVMIGRIGAPKNSALEVLSKQFKGKAKLTVQYPLSPLKSRKKKADYNLLSAGEEDGETAGMLRNGSPLLDPAVVGTGVNFGRGLNVAEVDPKKGTIIKFKSFDTYLSSSQSTEFRRFIGNLPYGRLVFIIVLGDAERRLDPISKWTIEGLGSTVISKIARSDSFAMIGRIRAEPGSAVEKLQPSGYGLVNLRVPDFKLRKYKEPKKEIDIRLYSGGPDDTDQADILVNGKSVFWSTASGTSSSAEDGINIAIVDEVTGAYKNFKNFRIDLSSSARTTLVEFLKSLNRNGALVLVVMKGSAVLPPEAVIQMQTLGAVKIKEYKSKDSYAMIGIVGAREGHATEVLSPRFSGPAKLVSRNFKLK